MLPGLFYRDDVSLKLPVAATEREPGWGSEHRTEENLD